MMLSNGKNFVLRSAQNLKNAIPAITSTRCQSTVTESKPVTERKEREMAKELKPSESFVMNLFLGKSVTKQVAPYPDSLSAEGKETAQMLIDPTERFFNECNDPVRNDMEETVNAETVEGLKALGAFGMLVPEKYGGVGLNNTQYARLAEIIGANDLGLGIFLGAHQSIGYKGILICGNEDQKAKYLPDVASGEKIAAFALTEPSSGSDAGSIKSRAVPSADGSYYTLNGSKIWISNGGLAEVFTVFAQTPVLDPKTNSTRDMVTAFIVERSFGGLTHGLPEKKMGIKASNTAEVYFEDVKIPAENVLGGLGKGFKVAMEILNNGRFGMCAALTGTQRYSTQKAIDFATNRTQFGRKIDTFGAIQEKIARMAMRHYISESMGLMIASNMDMGSKDYHLEAAISKIFASEAAWTTTDEAIQVMGGMGFMKESGLEKVLRDLRIFRIFEGTNDILRLFVALTGLQHAGGHLKELQNALKNPAVNLGLIIDEGSKRAKRAIGLGQGMTLEGIHSDLTDSSVLVAKGIEAFGASSEHLLMKHGKKIVEQQFLLNRLAESTIDLYTSAVALSRASNAITKGLDSAEHEKKIATVWTSEAMNRVHLNLTATKSETSNKNFQAMAEISKDVCEKGEIVAERPLGF